MKKFLMIVLVIVIGSALTFGMAYAIDRNRMETGKPVVFSTWGKDYTPKSQAPKQETKTQEPANAENTTNTDNAINTSNTTSATPTDVSNASTQEVTLYFVDADLYHLHGEKRTFDTKDGIEKAIVEAVIAGPQSQECFPAVTSDVKVLSASVAEGSTTCVVDLSKEFVLNNTGGDMDTFALYSIVNSLCQLSHVNDVKINIEGNQNEVFGHYDIGIPVTADMTIVK